jgi:hypothetical protein
MNATTEMQLRSLYNFRRLQRALEVQLVTNDESPVKRYMKLGFGGAHTDSNQRLMYTSS